VAQPRFRFVSRTRPGQAYAAGCSSVSWRLIGPNNRELGRSFNGFPDLRACVGAVLRLQQEIDRAESFITAAHLTGTWSWRLELDGAPSPWPAGRTSASVSAGSTSGSFLAAVPVAQRAEGLTVRPRLSVLDSPGTRIGRQRAPGTNLRQAEGCPEAGTS
jgi:hypothetical protein